MNRIVEDGGTKVVVTGLNAEQTGAAFNLALTAEGRGICFNEKERLKLLVAPERAADLAIALLEAAADHYASKGPMRQEPRPNDAASLRLAADVVRRIAQG